MAIRFLVIWILFITMGHQDVLCQEFVREYVGVVFEPYTKPGPDKTNYEIEEIETMLQVVSKRFSFISTYGMGTTDSSQGNIKVLSTDTNNIVYPQEWGKGEAVGLTANAASNINKKFNKRMIRVTLGTWDNSNGVIMKEVINAFDAANYANSNFPETVTGVIVASHKTNNNEELRSVAKLISNTAYANTNNLSIGVRAANCDYLANNPQAPDVFDLLQKIHFIVCLNLPLFKTHNDISKHVESVGNYFHRVQTKFRQHFNDSFEVIGETGWPSFNFSAPGEDPFSRNLSVPFWWKMNDWAVQNKVKVLMFTAFDEPWKDWKPEESYYGWWKRVAMTGEESDFVEKEKITPKEHDKSPSEEEPASSSSSASLIVVIVISAVVVVSLLAGGILIIYKKLEQIRHDLLTMEDIRAFETGVTTVDGQNGEEDKVLSLPYDKAYEISHDRLLIDMIHPLGSGAYGSVYKAKMVGMENEIAVKMTRPSTATTSTLKSLLTEIKIMIHVGKHPNVIAIVGACTAKARQGVIIIVAELCAISLDKHLKELKSSGTMTTYANVDRYANVGQHREKDMSLIPAMLRWSCEIACGMEHIASRNIVHADLASRNVLLTADGTVKITDFGLSRRLYEYTQYVKQNQVPLPWRWMAPESLLGMIFTAKSDVWSYGITVWEIFSFADLPYPGLSYTVDFANQLRTGMRMSKPSLATEKLYSKLSDCWNNDPEERPTFTDLMTFMNDLLQEVPNPPAAADSGYL